VLLYAESMVTVMANNSGCGGYESGLLHAGHRVGNSSIARSMCGEHRLAANDRGGDS